MIFKDVPLAMCFKNCGWCTTKYTKNWQQTMSCYISGTVFKKETEGNLKRWRATYQIVLLWQKKQSGQFLHAMQDIYPISQYTDVKKLSSMSQGLMGSNEELVNRSKES